MKDPLYPKKRTRQINQNDNRTNVGTSAAAPAVRGTELKESPENPYVLADKAKVLARTGDPRGAEILLPKILRNADRANRTHHHLAYEIACIYALMNKDEESVKWLRESASTGFDCYSLFLRDTFLDPVRRSPEFIAFMAEAKLRNERYRNEFQ